MVSKHSFLHRSAFLYRFFVAGTGTFLRKGANAYAKKDYRTAVKYLREYVEKKPDAHAYYLLGYAYYKLKNHPESMRAFKEAYTLDPAVSPLPGKQ